MSPSPSEVICRITLARLVRRISGSVNSGRRLEVLLGVEPDRDARLDPAAAAGALVGRGLADRLDRQPLHLGARGVALDPRDAGVDDVPDAGHGQRGLGDVGGEHDAAPAAWWLEDPVLLGGREPGVERHDLEPAAAGRRVSPRARRRCRGSPARRAGRPGRRRAPRPDSSLTASTIASVWSRTTGLALLVVLGELDERAVADLDRVGAAGDLDDRRRPRGGRRSARRTARGRWSPR